MSLDTAPTMHVSLTFSCRKIKSSDAFSKSDPYLVLYDLTNQNSCLGRTETIKNSTDPNFLKEFKVPYHFEQDQYFQVKIFDDDFGRTADDFLGECKFKLGNVMGSRGQKICLYLENNVTQLIIRGEQLPEEADDTLVFKLSCENLDRKDQIFGLGFGRSDPFFVISVKNNKNSPDSDYVEIFKSEVIKQNLNPIWNKASIPIRKLQNKYVKIEVIDWDSDGTHDLIGICENIQVSDFTSKKKRIPVIHPPNKAKYAKSTYKNSGFLNVLDCTIQKGATMVDYLRGGLEISLMVAIDFTGSNGDPRLPNSLHYGSGMSQNQYLDAVTSVGSIVIDYDVDKFVPAFGFGAKPTSVSPVVSHCFPLSGNEAYESVFGIQGVVEAYRSCFARGIILSGPTYFAPLIRKCTMIARNRRNTYSVLLLLTDGAMNDLQETIDAIIEASSAPLSIIIVGLGNGDFSSMVALDGEVQPLISSQGILCTRDIVQFVPFNQVMLSPNPLNRLRTETLAELPGQITSFYLSQGIFPNPPINLADTEIPTFQQPLLSAAPTQVDLAKIGKEVFVQAHAI